MSMRNELLQVLIGTAPLGDSDDMHKEGAIIDLINDTDITRTNAPCVGKTFEQSATRRSWRKCQATEYFSYAGLVSGVEAR